MATAEQPDQKARLLQTGEVERPSSPLPSHAAQSTTRNAPADRRRYVRRVWRSFLKRSGLGALWSLFWIDREEPKIIIEGGVLAVLSRTTFHFLALAMTIVLSYLQISGFYIGGTLEGWNGSSSEAAKQLLIQVAAKALEIIVIGSLTTVAVDIIRSFLLGGSIPLGMFAAHLQFADPLYFISEGFWASWKGFEKKVHFFAIAFFLFCCGVMALLTGPATAVLLVPVWRDMWYGGGTAYWLAGNSNTLWPQKLTINDIGTTSCFNPTFDQVYTQVISSSGCVWAGYNSLRENYKSSHQSPVDNVTIYDGFQQRLFVRILVFAIGPC